MAGASEAWTVESDDERRERDVADKLMDLAGGDPFADVRGLRSSHQRAHGCGLHNAGAPQMQLVAALARTAAPRRVLDLGSGLGYSTLWIASVLDVDTHVLCIDSDAGHVRDAAAIADRLGYARKVSFV